jgi:SAM-dependent methyltransferase
MVKECAKAVTRRLVDANFANRYFVGRGVDIGGAPDPLGLHLGFFPRMTGVDVWDLPQGDAQYMQGVSDAHYDFVHSSHCLEHLRDPYEGLRNWFRILKPGGHLVIVVPEEDMYEQGVWPSTFNIDHKWTFTMRKQASWSPVSINVLDLVASLGAAADIRKLAVIDAGFRDELPRFDQTKIPGVECGLEIVIRKRPSEEVADGGRRRPPGFIDAATQRLLVGDLADIDLPFDQVMGAAVTSYQQGDLNTAEEIAHAMAIRSREHAPDALHMLAMIRKRRGDVGGALHYLRMALALRAAFPEALNSLGRLLEETGEPAAALRAFRMAAALHPLFAEPLHAMGRLLAAAGRTDAACRALECVLRLRPEMEAVRRMLADLRTKAGGGA